MLGFASTSVSTKLCAPAHFLSSEGINTKTNQNWSWWWTVYMSIFSSLDTSGHLPKRQTGSHELLLWVSNFSQVLSLLISHGTSHAIIITSKLQFNNGVCPEDNRVFFFFRLLHDHNPNANDACQKFAQDFQHSSPSCPEQRVLTAWVFICLGYICITEQMSVLASCLLVFMSQPGALCCAGCTLQSHSDRASSD